MIGDTYKLKMRCLGNPVNTVGVVFHEYTTGSKKGIQLIFLNGETCGFNETEQKEWLERLGHIKRVSNYEFKNQQTVSYDYGRGYWGGCFNPNNPEHKEK